VPTESFSTDDLRLLNMEETLEDTANFIRNFVPYANAVPNLTDPSILRPDKSPWIYVGGSYPGGKAAFMRQQYPELVYGAVSSSGKCGKTKPNKNALDCSLGSPPQALPLRSSTSGSTSARCRSTVPRTASPRSKRPSR
jgi:hypothetical protein